MSAILRISRLVLAAALVIGMSACGEPVPDVDVPERDGASVADLAGILDADALESLLASTDAAGLDLVALTYETPEASCGEAFRAGLAFARAWDADIAVVAVAAPGDFTSEEPDRERCVGIRPVDDFAVGRSPRERIAEQLLPPIAADNDWDEVFRVAVTELAAAIVRDAG